MSKCNILLGCTGSVASIKVPDIVNQLNSSNFKAWESGTDPELHIELGVWADVAILAPLDANTLGKIASGVADNLLTRVVRAWDCSRPLLFAPAMNTRMWQHPITAGQIGVLRGFGFEELECIEKTLVCGDTGKGAMASVSTIVEKVEKHVEKIALSRLQP